MRRNCEWAIAFGFWIFQDLVSYTEIREGLTER